MGKKNNKFEKRLPLSSLAKGGRNPELDNPPKGSEPVKGEFIIELSFECNLKDDNLTAISAGTVVIGPNDPPTVEIPEPTKEMKDNHLKVDIVRPRVFKRVI